jgi:hypothetical protein
MGSTEAVTRNLEALKMQMECQAEFARSGLELALSAIDHWRRTAGGFQSDCSGKLHARERIAYFQTAASIFAEFLTPASMPSTTPRPFSAQNRMSHRS